MRNADSLAYATRPSESISITPTAIEDNNNSWRRARLTTSAGDPIELAYRATAPDDKPSDCCRSGALGADAHAHQRFRARSSIPTTGSAELEVYAIWRD